jgi:thiamine-monophosphate kinase
MIRLYPDGMKLSELGEFGLIDRLGDLLGEAPEGETWIGDDAAVLRAPGGTILFTADLLVEGVHFDLAWTPPADLGYKAVAVNCSDVAAMGGTPRRALVSLGVRPGIEVDFLEALYAGMRECSDAFGMAVVGGDVSRCDQLVVSVALLGNPAGRRVIERRGARPGDVICVTGSLGAAAAGLRLMKAGQPVPPPLRAAFLRPVPRVREVEVLRRFLPNAMIDVSDGLAADLGHLCDASGVGATVDAARLPLIDTAGLPAGLDALDLALGGGEDYELCFTIVAERAERAASEVEAATGTRVHLIGEVTEEADGRVLVVDGTAQPLAASGWDHLRP